MSVVFPNEIDEVLPGFEVIQSGALVLCVLCKHGRSRLNVLCGNIATVNVTFHDPSVYRKNRGPR